MVNRVLRLPVPAGEVRQEGQPKAIELGGSHSLYMHACIHARSNTMAAISRPVACRLSPRVPRASPPPLAGEG